MVDATPFPVCELQRPWVMGHVEGKSSTPRFLAVQLALKTRHQRPTQPGSQRTGPHSVLGAPEEKTAHEDQKSCRHHFDRLVRL